MRVDFDPVRLTEHSDVPHRTDSAARANVRLRDIDCPPAQQFAKSVQGMLVLATGNRRAQFAAKFDVAIDIFRHYRFLVPAHVVFIEHATESQRFGTAIGMIGIDH